MAICSDSKFGKCMAIPLAPPHSSNRDKNKFLSLKGQLSSKISKEIEKEFSNDVMSQKEEFSNGVIS